MKQNRRLTLEHLRLLVWVVAGIISLLTLLEFIPFFIALQAGIAGLNIVIFTPLAITAACLAYSAFRQGLRRTSLLSTLAATVAVLAIAGPMLSYAATAKEEGVRLSFSLGRYLAFTGDSIAPSHSVTYKTIDDQRLALALYQKDLSVQRPTILLVHGGGWQYGTHERTNGWPKLFRDAGYQVISVQYRLAEPNKPTWDKAPQDLADAVTYVKHNAKELGVDPKNIALFGQSAGGHLALLEANRSHTVQAVISLYPPIDLEDDYRLSVDKDTELAFIGGSPAEYLDRYQRTSAWLAASKSSPPTLLIQGISDDIVHRSASTQYQRLLKNYGVENRVVHIPYTGHSFDNQVGGFATQIAEQVVLDFLDSTL